MAPAFNISVPEDLHKEVNEINKYSKKIKISEVCQKALLEAVKEERTIEAESLAEIGAKRLMREIKGSQSPKDYYEECYQAGQDWAASEASLEELRAAFEYLRTDIDGNTVTGDYWALMNHFIGGGYIHGKVLKESMKSGSDSRLFQSFREGSRDMWAQIKEALEKQGYNISKKLESFNSMREELEKEITSTTKRWEKRRAIIHRLQEDITSVQGTFEDYEKASEDYETLSEDYESISVMREELEKEITSTNKIWAKRKLEQEFITKKEDFRKDIIKELNNANQQEIERKTKVIEDLRKEINNLRTKAEQVKK